MAPATRLKQKIGDGLSSMEQWLGKSAKYLCIGEIKARLLEHRDEGVLKEVDALLEVCLKQGDALAATGEIDRILPCYRNTLAAIQEKSQATTSEVGAGGGGADVPRRGEARRRVGWR